ncbi:MAG: hypothetical protein ACRDF0_09630 [Candidatus Limnocylindria bacterium]
MCPDGLFRRSLGLGATMAHGSGPTVDPIARPTQRISAAEIAQATSRRRNYWVPWDSIARAELRHEFLLTESLHLQLNDGRRRKFLWFAVDQAHLVLANTLEAAIGTRFVQPRTKQASAGTPRTESAEEWPVTLIANWVDPGMDVLERRCAVVLLAAGAWVAGASWLLDGRPELRILAVGVLGTAVVGWRAMRNRRVALELVLSPNSARIRESRESDVRTHALPREGAGRLTASESGLDWHDRRLALFDTADRLIAQFKARYASVTARSDSAEGDAWLQKHLPGVSRGKKGQVSVTALIGTWWPHPERRLSIRGSADVRRRWAEPDLLGFAAWDRKQRRQYAAWFGAFMLVFLVIGMTLPMSFSEWISYFPLCIAGLAFAIRHLLW